MWHNLEIGPYAIALALAVCATLALQTSLVACQKRCIAVPECNAMAWGDSSLGNACWLKGGGWAAPVDVAGYHNGVLNSRCTFTTLTNQDLGGGDLPGS